MLMDTNFDYILNKISTATIVDEPFKHISIQNLFSDSHFTQITNDQQIKIPKYQTDKDLLSGLVEFGYENISFPGCTTNIGDYLKWHSGKSSSYDNVNTCEGFGLTYRLANSKSTFIADLMKFLNSTEFIACIASRLSVSTRNTYTDTGIQKYLDGYEISPHPDIRKKQDLWEHQPIESKLNIELPYTLSKVQQRQTIYI